MLLQRILHSMLQLHVPRDRRYLSHLELRMSMQDNFGEKGAGRRAVRDRKVFRLTRNWHNGKELLAAIGNGTQTPQNFERTHARARTRMSASCRPSSRAFAKYRTFTWKSAPACAPVHARSGADRHKPRRSLPVMQFLEFCRGQGVATPPKKKPGLYHPPPPPVSKGR